MSGAHGHIEGDNKKIALLIAVLALFLALAETMAKGAQTNARSYNVEASNYGRSSRPRPSARPWFAPQTRQQTSNAPAPPKRRLPT